jgi:hypothetical protein
LPLDVDAMAAEVVSLVKNALAPVLVRLAAVEARPVMSMAEAELRESLAGMRERVAVVETKAAVVPPTPIMPDVAPLQARIEALEAARVPVPEIAPEDIAASVAGLLRKELADLELPAVKPSKRIVRDGTGAVKFEIEETR